MVVYLDLRVVLTNCFQWLDSTTSQRKLYENIVFQNLPVAHCRSLTYGPQRFQYFVRSLSSLSRLSSSVRYS